MSESADVMLGYEGQSLTFSCPGYTPQSSGDLEYYWKKFKNGQFILVASYLRIVHEELGPMYFDDLANGRASLSTSNGDLTITSLQLSRINDEAIYQCDFLNLKEKNISIQINGKL